MIDDLDNGYFALQGNIGENKKWNKLDKDPWCVDVRRDNQIWALDTQGP